MQYANLSQTDFVSWIQGTIELCSLWPTVLWWQMELKSKPMFTAMLMPLEANAHGCFKIQNKLRFNKGVKNASCSLPTTARAG